MAQWTIKNYNLFVATVRDNYGLTSTQARVVYNAMRKELERPVFSTDLTLHTRIAKSAINIAERSAFREKEERQIEQEIMDSLDMEEDFQEFEGGIDYA